ncbi:Heterokaryon incompatibility [Niveomyces insectorum RCEF 264]|uniref:Heterokaryon incompatibility n=1 Tax=Niveomyces insectorum RCEF 264 TaxID=1081102 RepID=A0A167S2V6_9HYPO|nr:Heterokaryon incompatibility [Niveomyces insectorum RCEF 264]
MAPHLLVEYTHDDSDNGAHFSYGRFMVDGANRVAGAFRVVSVDALIKFSTPTVQVWQYPHIRWGAGGGNFAYKGRLGAARPYVALSHVWSHAADVDAKLNTSTVLEPFKVDVDPHNGITYKKLSWVGLKQVAQTAKMYGRDYLWIDFFCIDQIDMGDNEVGLQICIMADIYRYARWVLVMIGGMGAVVKADTVTSWMDRAWTLQEAVVNPKVWVLVLWDKTRMIVPNPRKSATTWNFHRIGPSYKAALDMCLIRLTSLLDLADAGVLGLRAIRVVDGATTSPGDVARRALRMALARHNKAIQYTGVWRSMYLRTSSKSADVVYSIMGIFKLQIDPFRKNREPRYLFNDLARKTASKPAIGPVWLTIGGVTGCDIPREKDSRLVLKFPHAEAAGEESDNEPPTMIFATGLKPEWSGYHVDDSQWFIKRFNIKFISQAHPHIINAVSYMMRGRETTRRPQKVPRVTPPPSGGGKAKKYVTRDSAVFNIGGYRSTLVWCGNLENAWRRKLRAVFVGEVGDMTKGTRGLDLNISNESSISRNRVKYDGLSFFVFLEYGSRSWRVVGDGVFGTPAFKLVNGPRSIFTIGANAQTAWQSWHVDSRTSFDRRHRYFHHSYGVEPLRDWRLTRGPEQDRIIGWFGNKHEYPPKGTHYATYSLAYDIDDLLRDPKLKRLNRTLATDTHPLSVVSTSACWNTTPRTAKTQTPWPVLENGVVPIPFSYGGWTRSACSDLSRAGVDGILLHDPSDGSPPVAYYQVRILFGRRVMYLQMKQDAATPAYWSQTYVVPYRYRGDGLAVINSDYIVKPVVNPTPRCAPVTELGLPLGASNIAVGMAIAQILMKEYGLSLEIAKYKAMLMWGTNLSGMVDMRAMELRQRYCFRGLDPGNYGQRPCDYLPW